MTQTQEFIRPVDYLKIGKKSYAIQELPDGVDVTEEVREFYKAQYDKFTREQIDIAKANISNEWASQLTHLQRATRPSEVVLPQEFMGKTTYYYAGRGLFLNTRLAMYHPTQIAASRSQMNEYEDELAFADGVHLIEDHMVLTIEQEFVNFPVLIGFNPKSNMLLMLEGGTYHSFGDKKVCLGNGSAQQYWNLLEPHFSETISSINMFSLATHEATHSITGENINIRNLIENSTITRVEKYFEHDEHGNSRRAGVWTTE